MGQRTHAHYHPFRQDRMVVVTFRKARRIPFPFPMHELMDTVANADLIFGAASFLCASGCFRPSIGEMFYLVETFLPKQAESNLF
jgi:hypothetical protein